MRQLNTSYATLRKPHASLAYELMSCGRATSARSMPFFERVAQQRIPALAVGADPFLDTQRDKIIAFAARQAVPMMYQFREHAAAGGLMSYGVDLPDVYRHIGVYAARILKGAKPADLPVDAADQIRVHSQPQGREGALGLTFPYFYSITSSAMASSPGVVAKVIDGFRAE